MDDDWDLHAVVRGCAAPRSPTTTAARTDAVPTLPSNLPPFGQIQNSSFHGRMDDPDPFVGLHQIYQEFIGNHPPAPPTTAAAHAAVMPVPVGHVFQPQQEIVQIAPPLQMNMQRFPAPLSQHIRPRRRKNQQTKLVRQMTQEELSADSWAWRKYGQKPIKGSPYPRNYYRCSTSKGCAARKQVERSPDDAAIFIVSYSGEHTHARPTHRSSLAGSSRSKFVVRNNNALLLQRGSASTSSPPATSLSPAAPIDGNPQNDDVQMADDEDAAAGDDDTENLINDEDDMFRGFQDSDHSSGGGGGFLSSPSWSPAGSAAAFNGGGGC